MSEILKREINLKHLLKKLYFTEQDIVDASIEQGRLFEKVSEFRVQRLHEKNKTKQALDLMKAEVYIRVRENSESKISEPHIAAKVTKNRKHQEALSLYNEAMEMDVFADLLCKAYEYRMWAIQILSKTSGMEQAIERRLKQTQQDLLERKKKISDKYGDDDD